MAGRFLNSNTASIYAAFRPRNQAAQRSAMADQNLQYAMVLEERQRIQASQTQSQINKLQATQQAFDAMPMEAPDRERATIWWNERKRELAKRIEGDYKGNVKQFLNAEMDSWTTNTISQFMSSDLYNVAQSNKRNIEAAREAVLKGQNLIGGILPNGLYKAAESDMSDYYNGKSTVFNFKGAYNPKDDDTMDFFQKIDNPHGSKYDKNARVPQTEILQRLKQKLGDQAGEDKYYRDYIGRDVHYKRYSDEDFQKNLLDMDKLRLSTDASRASIANQYDSIRSRKLRDNLAIKKSQQESAQMGPNKFLSDSRSQEGLTSQVYNYNPTSEGNKSISTFGPSFSIGDITTRDAAGNNVISMVEIPGLPGNKLISEAAGLSGEGARVKELIIPSKGVVMDLSEIPHEVVSTNTNSFYQDSGAYGGDNNVRAYAGAKVKIKKEDAKKAKLTSGWFSSSTELGAPNVEVRELDSGDFIIDGKVPFKWSQNLDIMLNKSKLGQKSATEATYQTPSFLLEF